MKNNQGGFVVPLVLALIAALLVGGGVYTYKNRRAEAPVVVDVGTRQQKQNQQQTEVQTPPAATQQESAPTAAFTVNGESSAVVKSYETVTIAWSSTNANEYSSSVKTKNCTDPTKNQTIGGVQMNRVGKRDETLSDVTAVEMAGCDMTYTYTAKNNRTGQQAVASITLFIRPGAKTIDANTSAKTSTCGIVTDVDGNNYETVKIGAQCWTKQNMRVGAMLENATSTPSQNSVIEKWCANNASATCDIEGGLYTWAEALQVSPSCNTTSCTVTVNQQGICPSGWHIPSDIEYKTLETYLGMTKSEADATGWRGTDQGTKLHISGTSAFDALFSGLHRTDNRTPAGGFYERGAHAVFWSSSETSQTTAEIRDLLASVAGVNRDKTDKTFGLSVRCIKN